MSVELAQTVDINLWAVLVATVATMAVGMVWYAPPVFGKKWQELVKAWTKIGDKGMKEAATTSMIGSSFANLVMVYVLAYVFGLLEVANAWEGVTVAAWLALGFGVTLSMIHALYHGERKKLWLINTGYTVASMIAAGAILGAWR